jgi:shikimate kinase
MTLLGEAVLAQRFTGNLADDLLGVALALTAAIAGIKLLGRLPKNRTVRMVFTFGKIVAGVYTLWIFARWAADTLLDSASTVLPFITFGAVALALGLSGREKVIKAALVLVPITVVFLLLVFGFSLPFMEVKYLIPYKAPTLSGVGRAFLSSFLPLAGAILPIAESFSGKFGGGKGLALGSALLGMTFIDTDEEIVKREGTAIPAIFEKVGEAGFRDIESAVIREISARQGAVIATGGGAVLRQDNVRLLKENGRLYFVDRPLEDLAATADRPLSSDRDALERRYRERYDIYCACCDCHITETTTPEQVARRIEEEANHEIAGTQRT